MRTAQSLLLTNIRALLKLRHMSDADLAAICGHQPAWISKVMRDKHKGIKLHDIDCIASVFGVAPADLFQYGTGVERRRVGERRSGKERRQGLDRRQRNRWPTLPMRPPLPEKEG